MIKSRKTNGLLQTCPETTEPTHTPAGSCQSFFFISSKVSLLEDSDSNIHLKNLSLHQASNEEEGMEDSCKGVVIMWYSV